MVLNRVSVILAAGFLSLAAQVGPAWAGIAVDLGGEPVRALRDGRVVLLLEIRSDTALREVRIETSERLPLSPVGAHFDEKTRWQSAPISLHAIRLLPMPGGGPVQSLNVGVLFQRKGGIDPVDVFQQGGRERRPSFWLVGIRMDGHEERVEVSLPFVPNVQVSHE